MKQLSAKLIALRTKLVIGAIVIMVAIAGLVVLFVKKNQQQISDKPPGEAVAILPVPEPKEVERLRDIPATEVQKRTDFLRTAAISFGAQPTELTPKAVANACVYDATAQIANDARASEAYRNDAAKVKADIEAVNRNCYARYAEADYVPPTRGPAHVHPDTLQAEPDHTH